MFKRTDQQNWLAEIRKIVQTFAEGILLLWQSLSWTILCLNLSLLHFWPFDNGKKMLDLVLPTITSIITIISKYNACKSEW